MITMTCLIGDCGLPKLPGLGKSLGFGAAAAASTGPMDIWIMASDNAVPRRPRSVCETIAPTFMFSPGHYGKGALSPAVMLGMQVLQTGDAWLNSPWPSSGDCFLAGGAERCPGARLKLSRSFQRLPALGTRMQPVQIA